MSKFKKGIKYLGKAIAIFAFSHAVYWTCIGGTQHVANSNSTKIKTQSQLEVLLKKEKKKFGLDRELISAILVPYKEGKTSLMEDGSYEIVLGGNLNSMHVLKHELCHIFYKDIEGQEGLTDFQVKLRYMYWSEPRATICSLIK